MEIESSEFDDLNDDEVDEIIDDDLIMESDNDTDNPDETFVKPEKRKYDVRRRLEQYFEDERLKRELDFY